MEARHVDSIWPIWNVLDVTPEGRGTESSFPALRYDRERPHVPQRVSATPHERSCFHGLSLSETSALDLHPPTGSPAAGFPGGGEGVIRTHKRTTTPTARRDACQHQSRARPGAPHINPRFARIQVRRLDLAAGRASSRDTCFHERLLHKEIVLWGAHNTIRRRRHGSSRSGPRSAHRRKIAPRAEPSFRGGPTT